MSAYMEQIVSPAGWSRTSQEDLAVEAESFPAVQLTIIRDTTHRPSRKALLTSIVEAQIIPRLAQARSNAGTSTADRQHVTTDDDTAALVNLLLTDGTPSAIALINELRARGATPAMLFLGIVTQAARCLGELWEHDRCDFTQVTVGMGTLQQVMRALSPAFQTEAVRRAQTDSILLVPAPGEQHTLGLIMLAEFFRREGWHVAGGPMTSAKDAANIVHGTWMDVVGLSIGSDAKLEDLARCIHTVRQVSLNRDIFVMVGGPLFLAHPELVTRVGADTTASDAEAAVRQARGSLAMRTAAD